MRFRLRARGCLLAAAVIAGFVPSPPLVAQTPVKRVLIIHGGPEVFPGNFTFDAAIRQSLFSHPAIPVEAYSEYLENEEFADAADAALSRIHPHQVPGASPRPGHREYGADASVRTAPSR